MPYIPEERAQELRRALWRDGIVPDDVTPGDLTYLLTEVVVQYLEVRGIRYTTLNDCAGALENTKAELRERLTNRYEHNKRTEDGSVDPYAALCGRLAGQEVLSSQG